MADDLERALATGAIAAHIVREVTIGPPPFLPAYPYHRALRSCPFCDELYRRHGGFADHRDRCEQGPNPGANPVRPVEDDRARLTPLETTALVGAVSLLTIIAITIWVTLP